MTSIVVTCTSVRILILLAIVWLIIMVTCISMNVWSFYMKISSEGFWKSTIPLVWIIKIYHITRNTNIYIIIPRIPVWVWRPITVLVYWRNIIIIFQIDNDMDIRKMEMTNKVMYMVWPYWTFMDSFYIIHAVIVATMKTL